MMLQKGDKVLYVPSLEAHGLDVDHKGDHLFDFAHAPAASAAQANHFKVIGIKEGDPVHPKKAGSWLGWKKGAIETEAGARVVPVAPKRHWPGVVVIDPEGKRRRALAALAAKDFHSEVAAGMGHAALYETCKALGIDIPDEDPADGLLVSVPHPSGSYTLHLPVGGGPKQVRHDPAKGGHTVYKEGE